jgi:uncharacterized protein (TIGR02466 family)
MQEIYRLFPTTVGIYTNKNLECHDYIEKVLEDKFFQYKNSSFVKEHKILENFYQTQTLFHKLDFMTDINQFVFRSVCDFVKECQYDVKDEEIYIADSWCNVSTGNISTHTPHTHSNSFISAVYFLSAPPGSGSLYFLHPCMQINSIDPHHINSSVDNSTEFALDPVPGQCVIFKSSTIHGTTSNFLVNDYRISIAYTFNVKHLGKGSLFSHYEQQV